jgi:hypothetical protein
MLKSLIPEGGGRVLTDYMHYHICPEHSWNYKVQLQFYSVIYGCPEIVFEYKNDVVVEGYKIID